MSNMIKLNHFFDRKFIAGLIALCIWLTSSQIILFFTYDVITDQTYCTKQFSQGLMRDKCTKAVLINQYLTLLLPICFSIISYKLIQWKRK